MPCCATPCRGALRALAVTGKVLLTRSSSSSSSSSSTSSPNTSRGPGAAEPAAAASAQDPLSALERDLALQLQIARAAQRLCREENISKRLRKRRQTAALLEEQKLKDLENVLNQRRLLAGRRPLSVPAGTGAVEGMHPKLRPGDRTPMIAPQNPIPTECTPVIAPQNLIPGDYTPMIAPQNLTPGDCNPMLVPPHFTPADCTPMNAPQNLIPGDCTPMLKTCPTTPLSRAGWELPAATPATGLGRAGPAGTVTVPQRVGTRGVGEREPRPPGTRWVAAGAVGEFWQPPAAPAPFSPLPGPVLPVPGPVGPVPPTPGGPAELSASDESSLSDGVLLEEEETRPPGSAAPRRSPSPKEPTQAEGLGTPPLPPNLWRETSLDRAYEKATKPGVDPRDGEARGSWCYPGSPPAAPGSPGPAVSPVPRVGDVPPHRFVPLRTLVLNRPVGSSAPSTPEPSSRRGQSQSLRVETCWQPGEPRGRSAVPRRRPTYYTVTVPTSCLTPQNPPTHRSGSDDSISDLSSISHATSPGSSSPDVSFPRPPLPLAQPGYHPRGAPRLLPPAGPPTFLYEQDLAPLRYQRLVASHSRIVRTPSLKDYAPAGGGRGVSKAAVTEELLSWHQRARLRGARPHSLDRQGAFRGPRGGTPREVPITRGVLSWAQPPPWPPFPRDVVTRGPPARRVETCWQPGEPRGRSAVPRRRPTYYTVTVPTSCLTPQNPPTHRSGSDDSISDLSSISHATSPGSSSPDVSFPRPPLPLAQPGYHPRGAPRLLPPAGPPTFFYEQDLAPLRYQRLVASHSRIVRTPSLKDYAPAGGGRGVSKAAVTEELLSWHQRARLRGARPHSLDRQGAFRGPRGGTPREVPITRGVLSWAQPPPWPPFPRDVVTRGPPARRVETCWQPGEPRGRSAVPRRRPTYYTVTVPTSCLPPQTPPTHRSGSDDSISDLSSISHATSPGSSSPDVSFPRPPLPLAQPGYHPRGAPRLLPPAGPPTFLYEQDLAPLRYQRLVASHSRIVRTPSLKDYAPAGGGRGVSKAAVTEELLSWHQRARLRGARPHSLDRQGAFRGPRGGTPREVPITRGVLPWAQGQPPGDAVWGRGGAPSALGVPRGPGDGRVSPAAGGEDCLWYVDRNGAWHPGFDCPPFSFCCGTCHQRLCCHDPLRLITERQQRHCLAFR
ncbi:PREDICTED: proline-rich protein 36-like [Calidris pugnax]|uniref:proline-rich protein 36-like n=1 Tax=Calidris pugnax TaxID=198806 RepID=UPI00071D1861|nr:PREDICTED: proline-rich protein 36-like [Calidris pugnax]